ncbi:MAG: hypothetical protein AAGD35_22895 [Actinomycetota bacterium]
MNGGLKRIRIVGACGLLLVLAVVTGCRSSGDDGDAFAEALFDDPTQFLAGPAVLDRMAEANVEPGPGREELTGAELDRRLAVVVADGYGDDLFILREALLPALVAATLAAESAGDPAPIPDTTWLGHIDGRITAALDRAGYGLPEVPPNQAEVERVVDRGLLALIGASMGVDPAQIDLDVLYGGMQLPPAADAPDSEALRTAWVEENAESITHAMAVTATLEGARRIDLAAAVALEDAEPLRNSAFIDYQRGLLEGGGPTSTAAAEQIRRYLLVTNRSSTASALILVLSPGGEPLVTERGPVTLDDWLVAVLPAYERSRRAVALGL